MRNELEGTLLNERREKILKKEPTPVGFRTSSYTKQLASVRRSLSPTTNLRTEVLFETVHSQSTADPKNGQQLL